MIRLSFGLLLVAAFLVLAIALLGEPGAASVTWLGWQVNSTAAAAVLLIGLLAFIATVFWRAVIWLLQSPIRAKRAADEVRRRRGRDALTLGLLAAAAGDGAQARRHANEAAKFADDAPGLVRLLAAQAAEAARDEVGAKMAYEAMLGFPGMRLAAHRGLMQIALAAGNPKEALRQAEAAYGLHETAPWAWQAMLESRLTVGDWAGGLDLVGGAVDRGIVAPLVAARARAALETARAASLESAMDTGVKPPPQAAELAIAAARGRPDFTPAAVIAARLLSKEGRGERAQGVIESAWRARPHPALWRAWLDLRMDETPQARARRLGDLAILNPEHRESRILRVEQALILGDALASLAAMEALDAELLTRRLSDLRARVCIVMGRPSEARDWIGRGAVTALEADWSDIGLDGRAFSYSTIDWARLVSVYAERGELAHPRFERDEEAYGELRRIPADYVESQPFTGSAWRGASGEAFAPIIDDDDFSEALSAASGKVASRAARALGSRPKGR